MITWVGIAFGLCGIAVVASVLLGFAGSDLLVALVPITVALVITVVFARIRSSLRNAANQVRELPTRGIRRRGHVRDRARARIGTAVTILEHPDDPSLRALEGFLPNGRPAR